MIFFKLMKTYPLVKRMKNINLLELKVICSYEDKILNMCAVVMVFKCPAIVFKNNNTDLIISSMSVDNIKEFREDNLVFIKEDLKDNKTLKIYDEAKYSSIIGEILLEELWN